MASTQNGRKARHPAAGVGFTQVELLVVIGIIALLAAVLLPSVESARRNGKSARRETKQVTAGSPRSAPSSELSLRAQDGIVVPPAEALIQYQNNPGKPQDIASAGDESLLPAPDVDRTTAAEAPPHIRALHLETSVENAAFDNQPGQVAGFPGDNCDSCIPVRPGETYIGNNGNAATGAPTSCGGGSDVFDVWHCFEATCTGTAKISLCGTATTFDTTLAAYPICRGPELACNDDLPCGLNGRASQLEIPVVNGRPYFIRVAGFDAQRGQYQLNITMTCCVNCPTGSTAENEANCGLPDDTVNGGCNTSPLIGPQFSPIACGQTYCSTAAFDGTTRDTDWYEVVVTTPTQFTWTVSPEFAAVIGLVAMNNPGSGNCTDVAGALDPFAEVPSCSTGSVTVCLPPGKHWFFVAPVFSDLVNCGARYTATLTCATCTLPEACCLPSGGCQDTPPSACQGVPQGPGTSCATVVCTLPLEACCFQGGGCEDVQPFICGPRGGTPQGPGTSCANTLCPGPGAGACCLGLTCTIQSPTACSAMSGTYMGDGNTCGPDACVSQCCLLDAQCAYVDEDTCFQMGGIYWVINPRRTCEPNDCPLTGACCLGDGCVETARWICEGPYQGRFVDENTDCSPTICMPTGACCADGCFETDRATCISVGGPYLGDGTNCRDPAICQPSPPCQDCGPGPHWIDQCQSGVDLMPTGALVGISTNPTSCLPNLNLVMAGPVAIRRSGPLNDSQNFPGTRPIDNHLDVVDTEIVSMELIGGGVILRAGEGMSHSAPIRPSLGAIAEQPGDPSMADSFFDVFFEIQISPTGGFAYNQDPLRVTSEITCVPPDATYLHPTECVKLFNEQGVHIGNLTSANHSTFPACGDPGTGPCDQPHDTPFCDKDACCTRVCELRPNCCTQAWDESCVAAAEVVCNPGACCLPQTCATGGVCGQFESCGGGAVPCSCFTVAEGGGNCASNYFCANYPLCPNGTIDCPSGQICYVNTCCGQPTCGPAGCVTAATAAPLDPSAGPTASGEQGNVSGEIPIPTLGCIVTDRLRCADLGGTYEGNNTFCTPTTCAPPAVEIDHFPNTTAVMELQLPDGGNVPIALSGPTTVHVFFEGPNEGDANDNNGNGLDEVQTEMVDMQLTGVSPFGPVVVRLNPALPSRGHIEETANTQPGRLDLPPFAPTGTAASFFDVFFEIQVGQFVFHTATPKRMSSVIDHKPPGPGTVYENPEKIPLLDGNGNPTGFSIGAGRHIPNPVVEVDFFPNTTALMELQLPSGGSVPIALSGPTTVHVFFEGPNEGDASDNNGNGLDEVQTEMVDMQLTGVGPFGPVVVRLNPAIPSRGQIEETANTQPGRLDLPPFAPTGTANSFFDVFFEIETSLGVFHTATPKRMSSVIDHKPPGPGTVYENPEKIPLLDGNGNPTGFSIGAGRHIPRPVVEVDFFPNTTALMELQLPDGGNVPIALSGPTTVHVFFEGPNEGDANDSDLNGLDDVATEMVDMQLTGVGPIGPVVVRLNPNIPSRGQIEETANTQPGRLDLPPFAPTGTANSFFDVFFEIETSLGVFHTATPKRMSSVIDHKPPGPGTVYENPEKIPLLDGNGNPTGFSIGAGRHIPQPVVEVDFFPNTTAAMELQRPDGGSELIHLAGPTTVHVLFEGPNEGDASDNDGNGRDDVATEIVDMQLAGNSVVFGPVLVRLNPAVPSRGQIEETANTQPGRLDLPPFAPTGTADSFFDVFFEVQVGPIVFHTATPKRMSSVIDHKPPGPGTVYENLEKIPLLDANGNPTGFSIGAGRHIPQPPLECGGAGTGDCFTPHDTPFCDRGECCDRVCALVSECCTNRWNQLCAGLANDVCRPAQACCMPSGTCKDAPPSVCELGGGTPQGVETNCENTRCPRAGDCNADGHVDLRDVARFLECFTGPGGGPVGAECRCADLDNDGDVDREDWKILRGLMTGP